MKKIVTTLMMLFAAVNLFAATVNPGDEEGLFYSNGRIYVVVVCVTVILIGLLLYIFSIDRRIKKLEKNSPGKK